MILSLLLSMGRVQANGLAIASYSCAENWLNAFSCASHTLDEISRLSLLYWLCPPSFRAVLGCDLEYRKGKLNSCPGFIKKIFLDIRILKTKTNLLQKCVAEVPIHFYMRAEILKAFSS